MDVVIAIAASAAIYPDDVPHYAQRVIADRLVALAGPAPAAGHQDLR
jgi:hypothetical protein